MTRFADMTLVERVRAAVDAEGLRPFAKRSGVGVGAIRSLLDSRDPLFSNALKLSRALGLELHLGLPPDSTGVVLWQHQRETNLTLGEIRARQDPGDEGAELDPDDFVAVAFYGSELAAGGGADNLEEGIVGHLAFRRSWLTGLGVTTSSVVIARARGDSMSPTIQSGDAVLIDRQANMPPSRLRDPADERPAPIYALRDDGGARIKRLEFAAPGTLALLSDNPASPPEFRKVAEVSIIGRVRWWAHTDRS